MKYPYHTLLPVHMQASLMAAAATEHIETIDIAASELRAAAPNRFHDSNSVALRKFYHEPRQLVPNAGFVVAYPLSGARG